MLNHIFSLIFFNLHQGGTWYNSRKLEVLFQLCKQEGQFGLFDIFFNIRRTGLNLNKKKIINYL